MFLNSLLPGLYFLNVFHLNLIHSELEELDLYHSGRVIKLIHITQLHAAQNNVFPCNVRINDQTTRYDATEERNVNI
jgi:hypothetical protein